MAHKLSGAVSGFRMHSGYVGRRRSAHNFWADLSRYTADNLPEIRKRKGVGRPPVGRQAMLDLRSRGKHPMVAFKTYRAMIASHFGRESPNLAEWHRKPRRRDRAAA